MRKTFGALVSALRTVANRFDESSHLRKLDLLSYLAGTKLQENKTLLLYFDALLFICAHPPEEKLLALAERELHRISELLKRSKRCSAPPFLNSGLPFTPVSTRYSHDCLRWLLSQPSCRIVLIGFENPSLQLNEVLRVTLPSVEVSETTAGLTNDELLKALLVSKPQRLPFLLEQLGALDQQPYIKDLLFDRLDIFIKISSRDPSFSRGYNRLIISKIFFQDEIQKNFNHEELLERALPPPAVLTEARRLNAVTIIKNSMVLTDRETDPITYLDEHSLRLYELERGISIALYGVVPSRQLPLESYVGFTLFKNGFPACYGGGWVFGERSHFGINIFESFRGGESRWMMCQLLRTYRQAFGIRYFEVEPYQFGQDNPEGIQSGAFWFYYRFGFRPLDKELRAIAKKEHNKIKTQRGYRTPEKTLTKFTAGNIALQLGTVRQTTVAAITTKITRTIHRRYQDNRTWAVQECVSKFCERTGIKETRTMPERQVLEEVALWSEAFEYSDACQLRMLAKMIDAKTKDLYGYQDLLLRFFSIGHTP
jgi:hypothetical protein